MLAYDRTVEQVTSEQLLLNIERAKFYQPLHFTKVSSVSAPVRLSPQGGDSSAGRRGLVGPLFSVTAAENPIVTIIPI